MIPLARLRRQMLPLSPGTKPATAPIDTHAKRGMEAFDNLPEDLRAFMKRSTRQYKSLKVAHMAETLGEDLTLYRLRKIDRPPNHP